MMGHARFSLGLNHWVMAGWSRPLGMRSLFICVLLLLVLPVQALPLRGSWHPATAVENPETVRIEDAGRSDVAFDPIRLNAIPAGEHGAWILLRPNSALSSDSRVSQWPAGEWVLQVKDPGLQSISLFPAQGPQVSHASVLQPSNGLQGHGRIAFLLDRAALGESPLLLRMEPGRVVPAPLRFSLVSPQEFSREDARWLALATACFAIMAAMAVMALLFAIELRDITFLYYAGYVLAYALILAIQTGYVAAPLEWTWMAHAPNAWGRAATALSVLFATLFVARFAELAHYAPRMRIAVLTLGVTTFVVMSLGSLPVHWLILVSSSLINPLLIFGGPVILAASLVALWQGSRYAGFFLLGWTPLLVLTVLSSAQVFGVLATWTWLGDSGLVAGAFEALVLSLGLADRALALRNDRDIAQALADTDGLTNVFNRRGLDRRIADLIERAQRQRWPLTLLFLDLDRFKQLNDLHGHTAGDAALMSLARVMRSDMGVQDLLGRYGGEEFVAVLPGRDLESALSIARRICEDLQALRIPLGSADDVLTANIGIARLRRGDNIQALIERADQAMYLAKSAGGNGVSADAPTDERTLARPTLHQA